MQFKSLGEQIEFFLNPNHLDLWELQKSFKTMIDRYYRAKLTSRTLFELQKSIDEIEKLCEVIRLISNKKATKQCKKGVDKLKELLVSYSAPSYHKEILDKNVEEISELTDAMAGGSVWFELADYLQDKLYNSFRDCNQNYEFQTIIKTSKSGWTEALEFITSKIAILTAVGSIFAYAITLFIYSVLIGELKNKHLVMVLNNMSANYQIELLKALFMPLTILVIIPAIWLAFVFNDSNLILDKIKVKEIRSHGDARKFILDKNIKLIFIVIILGGVISTIHARMFNSNNSCLVLFIVAILLVGLYLIAEYVFSGIKDFLFNLRTAVLILLPMLFSLLWAATATIDKNLLIVDYILVIELLAIVVILITLAEMRFYNSISKAGLFVLIYFGASWVIISQQINILEFLGLRNNPNTISLLKLNGNSSSLTLQLKDMGFHQLKYKGNESLASDSRLEDYVFERGIESMIYLAESKVYLSELESYVINNKNTICNSKLNRAVLSEFENGDESKHYFGYEGCHANVNSFKFNEKIRIVNKLFLVRQSESNYTYWIFGAHVNWKKPDELIISAAKNDNFNTITLNKDRGMLYYDETTLRVDGNPEDQHNFSLTRYGNESSQSY